ncbi:MAG TPA: potassium channel family protein [Acidimicrobiia bacterium]|nr:potassium channel family protein [Acidimicrobiia bacterium]
MPRNLRQAFELADSYGLLLALLLTDYVLLMLSSPDAPLRILQSLFVGATVILAFHTSRARPRLVHFAVVCAVLVVVVSIGRLIFDTNELGGLGAVMLGILILLSPPVILRRVLGHERVGLETILGALCVYLMIGLLFAYTYASIHGFTDEVFVQQEEIVPSDYVYFSVVTLTTTGYGDLTPAAGAPRAAAMIEMLTGQIFLVTLVARLVALFGEERRTVEPAAPARGDPERLE